MDINGVPQRPLMPKTPLTRKNISDYLITCLDGEEKLYNIDGLSKEIQCTNKRTWSKQLLQTICDSKNLDVNVHELKNRFASLRNKRLCPISGEVHTNNNAYAVRKNDKIVFRCHSDKCQNNEITLFEFPNEEDDLENYVPWEKYINTYFNYMRDIEEDDDKKIAYKKWLKKTITDMNRYMCVISGNASPYIVYREYMKGHICYLAKKFNQFTDTFNNYRVIDYSINKPQTKSLSKIWLDSPKRRTCIREDKLPSEPDNTHHTRELFNTWTGFQITEKDALMAPLTEKDEEDMVKWLEFIRTCWCSDNKELYDYILNWMAHLIQKPGVKMGTAIVLKGFEGTGKGMIVQTIGKILGEHHFFHPSSNDEIYGQFNHLLEGKLLCFSDETFWGGDKKNRGLLMKLLTEERMCVNEKHMSQRVVSNLINWIFASNEECVVPTTARSRRFIVLDTSDWLTYQSQAVKERLAFINPHVVARYLYTRNITNFNPRDIPHTEALKEQKLLAMDDFDKWLVNLIENEGYFGGEYDNMDIKFDKYISKTVF